MTNTKTQLQIIDTREVLGMDFKIYGDIETTLFLSLIHILIDGIKYFNNKKSVDIIIIGRGGGALEELWNFNEEELAKAIYNSKLPIVSAVGHEVDFTISDFVADFRAATPSQAAEIVVPLEDELYKEINEYENKLNFIIDNKLSNERRRIQNLEKVLSLNSPSSKIVNAYLEIDNLKDKIEKIMAFKIKSNKQKIFSLNNMLNAHNPINILKRGYAIIAVSYTHLAGSIGSKVEFAGKIMILGLAIPILMAVLDSILQIL